MAEAVYLLCAVTSVACAVLLVRSWRATRLRLTLWTALCFVGLALNNVLLYVDLVLVPRGVDLSVARNLAALAGVAVLVFGLVWEGA